MLEMCVKIFYFIREKLEQRVDTPYIGTILRLRPQKPKPRFTAAVAR